MNDQETIIFENGRDFQRKQDESYDTHNKFASSETKDMFKDVNDRIEKVSNKMDKVHDAMFGINDFGGIISVLNEIKEQTKKTNGRVTKLEMWRTGIAYGIAVLVFIVPITIYYICK